MNITVAKLLQPRTGSKILCFTLYIMTRIKNIKNVARCGDSRSAKSKQGRNDSIKQFSIQPHPTYLSTSKICWVELCTVVPCITTSFWRFRSRSASRRRAYVNVASASRYPSRSRNWGQGRRKLPWGGAADRWERWRCRRQWDRGAYVAPIIPREARKKIFAFTSSYQGGLSWHLRTLKTRKRRFQTIWSHRSLALSTVAMWLPTDLTGRAAEFVNIGRNVVVASKSEGWCALSPIAGTGGWNEFITITQEYHRWYSTDCII